MNDPLTERRGSWGHSIRAATLDERQEGVGAGWIARTCGRTCGESIIFRASWRVTGVDRRIRLYVRFLCPRHAARFVKRWHLVLPSSVLPVDQALLPFRRP